MEVQKGGTKDKSKELKYILGQFQLQESAKDWPQIYRKHKAQNDHSSSYYKSFRSLQIYNQEFQNYFVQMTQNPFLLLRNSDNDHLNQVSITFEDNMLQLAQDIKAMGLESLALIVEKVAQTFKKQAKYFAKAVQKLLLKSKHLNTNNFSIKNFQYTDLVQENICKRCMEVVQQRILDKMKSKNTKVIGSNQSSQKTQQQRSLEEKILNQAYQKSHGNQDLEELIDRKLTQRVSLIQQKDLKQLASLVNTNRNRFSGLAAEGTIHDEIKQSKRDLIRQSQNQGDSIKSKKKITQTMIAEPKKDNRRMSQNKCNRTSIFAVQIKPETLSSAFGKESVMNCKLKNKVNIATQQNQKQLKNQIEQLGKDLQVVQGKIKQQQEKSKKAQKQVILLKIENEQLIQKVKFFEQHLKNSQLVKKLRPQQSLRQRQYSITKNVEEVKVRQSVQKRIQAIRQERKSNNIVRQSVQNKQAQPINHRQTTSRASKTKPNLRDSVIRSSQFKISSVSKRSNRTQILDLVRNNKLKLYKNQNMQEQNKEVQKQTKKQQVDRWGRQTLQYIKKVSHEKFLTHNLSSVQLSGQNKLCRVSLEQYKQIQLNHSISKDQKMNLTMLGELSMNSTIDRLHDPVKAKKSPKKTKFRYNFINTRQENHNHQQIQQ